MSLPPRVTEFHPIRAIWALCLLISIALLASTAPSRAIEFGGVNLPGDSTLQISTSQVSFDVTLRGTTGDNNTPYQYNIWVQGRDIYGNTIVVSLAQGIATVSGQLGTTPPTTIQVRGRWDVPNDGTLHNITTGYRMYVAVYNTAAPLPAFPSTVAGLTSNLALPLESSGLLKIEVLPDVEIPAVQGVAKSGATATATLSGNTVASLNVTSGGSGYDPNFPPTVTITGAGGSGAQFLAIVEAETGSVTGFNRVNAGSGYTVAPTVAIAPPPANMTQRTGGILYKSGSYYGGDIARFQATIRNRATAQQGRQSRPLRSRIGDRHRLNVILTKDPEYDESATPPDDSFDDEEASAQPTPTPAPSPSPGATNVPTDDYLLTYYDILGDMAAAPASPFSTIRAVSVYGTPRGFTQVAPPVSPGSGQQLLVPPTYGIANPAGVQATATAVVAAGSVTTITPTAPGGAGYDPLNPPAVTLVGPAGSFGATASATVGPGGNITAITVVNGGTGYTAPPTVTIAPPRVGARYYQPSPDDAFLDIGEQVQIDFEVLMPKNMAGVYYVGARADSLNNANFLPVDPLLRKTRISTAEARITLLSGPDPLTGIVSQVTADDGRGILQSNGASDRAAVDGGGRFSAFESTATDLAIPQNVASEATQSFAGRGVPLATNVSEITALEPYLTSEGIQQIYRRDLASKEMVLASVSSGGAPANGNCRNPAINRAPNDLATDGRFVAFESEASNLVQNDINACSDIFVRSYRAALRTARVSINEDGIQGNAASVNPAVSGNGRFIVFESTATNLDLANPVPSVSRLGSQIYVHDRDVSNSGTFDTPGNVRTFLVSLANTGSTRATASVSAAQIISGQVSAVSVIGAGANYLSAHPPAVIISPPPTVPGAVQATAEAVVNGAGQVINIRVLNPGAGYNPATPPTVTVAPRALPAGDTSGNNGWNNEPAISDDGRFVTWVSYSSNLSQTPGGVAVGNNGWRGVVYRVRLQDGIPLTDTIEAVSVNNVGALANLLAYQPTINNDGSVIAYATWANNLLLPAALDSNGVSDVYVRDYRGGINTVRRVSDSQPRLAIGTLFFLSSNFPNLPPNNNPLPANNDTITLSDGTNPAVNFVFGGNVPIGATASATRDNLIRAINNEFRAGRLNIIAGNVSSDRLRSVNTGSNQLIDNATDLLNFSEPSSNTPANNDRFYGTGGPGPARLPGVLLLHTNPDATSPNQPISVQSGGAPAPSTSDGVTTTYTMGTNLYRLAVSGMRIGGREAELDSGEFDGVPLGTYQPSVDQSGNTVAFKSTMASLDVFDRTFNNANGIFRGELLRVLYNAAGNIYVAERNAATGVTDRTTRVSVSRFGYRTTALLNTPSTAANHSPSISGNGRYVAFASDSDNHGGLIFGPTNLDPHDTNQLRDVFIHDRLVATDLPPVIENRRPQVILTEPAWLNGRQISVGSVVTLTALATDADQQLDADNVRFIINGEEIAPSSSYGNYFSYSYIQLDQNSSNAIFVRVRDDSGASNDTAISQPITFASTGVISAPTSITLLEPDFRADPNNVSGTPTVGFFARLSARVTLPFAGTTSIYDGAVVRFYANGVLVGETTAAAGANGQTVTVDWYPQSEGQVELTAVASTFKFRPATSDPQTWATLGSNTSPIFTIVGVAANAAPGSPEAIASALFQKVMTRAPSGSEQAYYATQLAAGTLTPARMVRQLLNLQEYRNLQNRIFDFYYRLETPPQAFTYVALLGSVRGNTNPLPATDVDNTVPNGATTPYGATEGQAVAAQQIVSSPGFNASSPGVANLSNREFVAWFRIQMAKFGGSNHDWGDTPVWNALMPGSTSPQGAAVAFMTAYYAAKNEGSAYGPDSAYQLQLYASSLQWLFTGVWAAPTTPAVSTQSGLDSFISNLLDRSEGQSTWAWINSFTSLTAAQRTAQAAPAGDGISNLLKYAFNMSPLVPGGQMAVGGVSGTPRGDIVTVNGLGYLQLTYVRRVNAPSVTYHPEFNWALNQGAWTRTTGSNPETVTPIGSEGLWERVTVRDIVPTSLANQRFGRMVINGSYWTPAQPNPGESTSPNAP